MNRIKELQAKRNTLADAIEKMHGTFNTQGRKWEGDSQRDAWNEMNAQYDVCVAEMDTLRGSPRRAMNRNLGDPNQSAAFVRAMQDSSVSPEGVNTFVDGGGFDPQYDQQMRDADMIVSAWVRNCHGEPVPADEVECCERNGVFPGGRGFTFRLNRCRPTLGRQLRFAEPEGEFRSLARVPLSSGGALVPTGFVNRLEIALKQFGVMLQTSEIWISEDGRPDFWPSLDDTGNEGVQIGEGVVSENSDMTFKGHRFEPYKFSSGVIKASHELLRDSAIALAGEIGNALGIRLGRIVSRRATTGHGGGQMMGIVPASTLGVTAASATVVDPDELIDLIASVDPAYHTGPGVGFMMNQTTYSSLLKLKTGDGVYLFGGNDKDQRTDVKLLRGFPVYINNHMDNPATGTRPVIFGDLSKYKLRIVVGVRLRQLDERYAEYDQTGFLGFLEADGKLLDAGMHPVKCLQMA